jgi:hypothetical protein
MKMLIRVYFFLLLTTLACSPGESGKVRPVGESATVPAANPDTVISQPAPAATTPAKKAQRAWDTAATESFDVEELNRRRAEPKQEPINEPAKQRIDTMRVKPTDFPGLPENIALWLEERGYTIPQTSWIYPEEYANAIMGSFIREGQIDWAVLVSRAGLMSLLVFSNSSVEAIHNIFEDVGEDWWTYVTNPEVAVYLYEITKYTINEIEQIRSVHPDVITSPILNECIHFYVIEKASSFYYYQDSVWLNIPYMD